MQRGKIDMGELASASLVLLGFVVLMFIYFTNGPSWDVVAQYMYGKGVLTTQFLSHNFTISGDTVYSNGMYIELFRYPLPGLALGVLSLILNNSLLVFYVYVALLYVLYVYSLDRLARTLGINGLVLFALFINPYTVAFMFINNGSEALGASLLLLGISAVLEGKEKKSGAMVSLMSLARYNSLIFLPLLLFLKKREKIFASIAILLVPIGIWLVVNYYFFGNPFYSYYTAIIGEVVALQITQYYPAALVALLGLPAIFFAFYLIAKRYSKYKKLFKEEYKIAYALIALAVVGFILIEPRYDAFQQARLGYPITITLLFLAALLIGSITNNNDKRSSRVLTALGVLSAALLLWVAYYYYFNIGINPNTAAFSVLNQQSVFVGAKAELAALGLGGCRVISNQWVLMRYYSVPAYSIYSINASTLTYPIVDFNYSIPMPHYLLQNISKTVYSDNYFSIYLPKGYACVS